MIYINDLLLFNRINKIPSNKEEYLLVNSDNRNI